ncbi:modification methylase HemK [Ascodesmis nigricans]|uniref:peptide chain release factor N(5)-glutamine methyltransferase n=1 Tax=Ascodesmis nigricans TaxID=341454 RepID=A0A4S2N416_9PEZI|nr:modification methylase HemK [Ascodesmis nigricans]
MPRLPATLLRKASRISPNLRLLLPEVRSLSLAKAELRWLSEHAQSAWDLTSLCLRRGRLHEPLQYLLGSQPFSSLDIAVTPGVLIPRPETEQYTVHLAALLRANLRGSRILDLCTGTGCIALTLAAEAAAEEVVGVDVSPVAVGLARKNMVRNSVPGKVRFVEADIREFNPEEGRFDVVVSNPPYVAEAEWWRSVGGSVRKWEPKLAVVADEEGDEFYGRIQEIAVKAQAKVLLAEVGGMEQAERVRRIWGEGWEGTDIWKDYAGRGRAVVAWRKGAEWMKECPEIWG